MIIAKSLLSKLHLAVIDKTHNLFTLFFNVNQTHIV